MVVLLPLLIVSLMVLAAPMILALFILCGVAIAVVGVINAIRGD